MTKPRNPSVLAPPGLAPVKVFSRVRAPQAVEDAVTLVEEVLGGREKILETLAFAESTPLVQKLLALLGDPANRQFSLAELCIRGNLTPGDLLAAYRKAHLGLAQALSTRVIAQKLPEVTEDVMLRATPHEVECPTCRGTGEIRPRPTKKDPTPEPITCPECNGERYIAVLPDLDRQKVALDLGQLVPKAPNVAVQVNQSQQTLTAGTGNLVELQQAVGDLLYGSTPDSAED